MFRILIVDDDRAGANLLRKVMENLRSQPELHFVWDGAEALDFLHRRGAHSDAPRPNLILLDVNMPRLGGLETLSAIKSDPELHVIPVIMFSASTSPDDIRESYRARANCYVQKPTDLDRSVKLMEAIETFWIDTALRPPRDPRTSHDDRTPESKRRNSTLDGPAGEIGSGSPIASSSGAGRSEALRP